MNKNLIILGFLALASTYLFVQQLKAKPTLSGYDPAVMESFQKWQTQYGKKYDDPDLSWYRFTVFASNYQTIQTTNAAQNSYFLVQTQFMDLTNEEFAKTYLQTKVAAPTNVLPIIGTEGIAASLDWRTKNAVSEVKDQGQCGSCWAFSTTGALESFVRVNDSKSTILFSEQDLVDCSGAQGNEGCNGGLMDDAFTYVIANGIAQEKDYAYKAVDGKCNKKVARTKDILTAFTDVPQGSTTQLKAALQRQPIAIAVDANNWSLYGGGVFDNCEANLDHGVLLIGYDTQGDWIVKNSWGNSWGESGFIRLKSGNTCGLANSASYPTKN